MLRRIEIRKASSVVPVARAGVFLPQEHLQSRFSLALRLVCFSIGRGNLLDLA